jgi:hypothetical protein
LGVTQEVQSAIADDGGHPAQGISLLRIEIRRASPNFQKTVLQGLLGPIPPSQDTEGEAE